MIKREYQRILGGSMKFNNDYAVCLFSGEEFVWDRKDIVSLRVSTDLWFPLLWISDYTLIFSISWLIYDILGMIVKWIVQEFGDLFRESIFILEC